MQTIVICNLKIFIQRKQGLVICDRHWPTNFATTKIFGKTKTSASPSVFKGVPKSSFPTRNLYCDELSSIESKENIHSYSASKSIIIQTYSHDKTELDVLIITSREYVPDTGIPMFILKIKCDLSFETCHAGTSYKIQSITANFSGRHAKFLNR